LAQLVGQHHQLYLGLGADIVMESLAVTVRTPAIWLLGAPSGNDPFG
jgi:hypothetical protein